MKFPRFVRWCCELTEVLVVFLCFFLTLLFFSFLPLHLSLSLYHYHYHHHHHFCFFHVSVCVLLCSCAVLVRFLISLFVLFFLFSLPGCGIGGSSLTVSQPEPCFTTPSLLLTTLTISCSFWSKAIRYGSKHPGPQYLRRLDPASSQTVRYSSHSVLQVTQEKPLCR